ncbi:MAG: PilN domain-containing protein [Sarcina sp.]
MTTMIARDINFFAPYVKEEERSTAQLALTATATVVMVGIAGTLGYNLFQINDINKEIIAVDKSLASPTFIEQHKQAETVILKKSLLQGFNTALMTVHDGVVDRTIIDTKIIKQINKTVPQGVILKNLAIQDGTITIQGTAKNEKEVADMKHELDMLPMIRESFVPAINSDFGTPAEYTFSINCVLEEVYDEN